MEAKSTHSCVALASQQLSGPQTYTQKERVPLIFRARTSKFYGPSFPHMSTTVPRPSPSIAEGKNGEKAVCISGIDRRLTHVGGRRPQDPSLCTVYCLSDIPQVTRYPRLPVFDCLQYGGKSWEKLLIGCDVSGG